MPKPSAPPRRPSRSSLWPSLGAGVAFVVLALALPVLANDWLIEVPDTPTIKILAYRSWIADHLSDEPYHELDSSSSYRALVRLTHETWDSLPATAFDFNSRYPRSISDVAPLPVGEVDTYHGPLPGPRPGDPVENPDGGLFVAQGFRYAPYLFGGVNASSPPGVLQLVQRDPTTLLWAPQAVRDEIRSRVFDLDLSAVPNASAPLGSIQWADDLRAEYKIEQGLEDGDPSATEQVWLAAFRTGDWTNTQQLIEDSFEEIDDFESDLHFKYVRGSVREDLIEPLALRPDVISITREQYLVDKRQFDARTARRDHRETHVAWGPGPAPDDRATLLLRTGGTSRGWWRITDESLDRLAVDERQYWKLLSDVVGLPNDALIDLFQGQATPAPSYDAADRRLVLVSALWRDGLDDVLEEIGVSALPVYRPERTLFVDGEQQEQLEALLIPPSDWEPQDPDAPERFLRFVEPLRPEWKTLDALSGVEPPERVGIRFSDL